MSRDDKVTMIVVRGRFRREYHQVGRFWYLVPNHRWNWFILVGQEWCTGYDEAEVQRVFERVRDNGCKGLFLGHMWEAAINYAFRLDSSLGYTEYGVRKRPKVATIDMVTGHTTFSVDIRRLVAPSDEWLPRYSRIVFYSLETGEYMCGLKRGDSLDEVSKAIVSRNKKNALRYCLRLMDEYPAHGVNPR